MADDDLNGLDLPEFGFLPFDLYVIVSEHLRPCTANINE